MNETITIIISNNELKNKKSEIRLTDLENLIIADLYKSVKENGTKNLSNDQIQLINTIKKIDAVTSKL